MAPQFAAPSKSPASLSVENHRPFAFSKRAKCLLGQEMFKVLDRAREIEEAGTRIYHLELGNPRLQPPLEIIEATIGALRSLNVGYTSSAGLPDLRRALAQRYTKVTGRSVRMENVVVSPANLLISQFLDLTCDRGDRVVLFTPTFPSYLAATQHIGLQVVEVALDPATGYDLREEQIEAALEARPRAILVNSANNPTGAVYGQEALESLAKQCHQRGIWLLSDETYAEVCFGRPFFSLSALSYPQLVVMSSFSKIFSIPGFRIGYALAHETVADKMALSNSTLFSCLPAFTQLGCMAGLGVLDEYVKKTTDHFANLVGECSAVINASGVLGCAMPQAGFYIFLDISRTRMDDLTFSSHLLEERHTAVTPGRSFGRAYTTSIRIATCGQREDVIHGTKEIIKLAQELIG